MTSVPLDSNTSPPEFDHFSSLPNELLDTIFEYAYIDSPASRPLSKRLLPFFEKHLYRRVSLTSLASFTRFVAHFPRARHTAQLVHDLTLPTVPDDLRAGFEAQLPGFLSLLPNLINLTVPFSPPLVTTTHHANSTEPNLPRLEYLSTSIPLEPSYEPYDGVDLDKLAQFVSLPALKRLKIYDWQSYNAGNVYRSPTTRLPQVTELKIEGEAADIETIKSVLETCPSLLHLDINCTYETGPEFVTRLPLLPSTLHSLSLHSTYHARDPVDSILSRLTQLRYLHLGRGCYSRSLFTVLQQLPHLVELHLDHGTLDPTQLQALLADPSRRLPLQSITLNFDEGQNGSHIPKPSTVATDHKFGFESDFLTYSNLMPEWCLPGAGAEDTPNVVDLGMLQSVAEDNGLGIKGNLKSTIQMITDYHIEANNRAVLMSYRHRDLDYLRDAQTASTRDGVAPPPLDLDSLDIDRLEIVEIDLPEQDWFMLSLRNKE